MDSNSNSSIGVQEENSLSVAAIVTGLEQPAELSHDDSSSHTAKRIPVSRHRSGTLARTAAAAVGRIKCAFKFDLNAEYDTDIQSIMPVGSLYNCDRCSSLDLSRDESCGTYRC